MKKTIFFSLLILIGKSDFAQVEKEILLDFSPIYNVTTITLNNLLSSNVYSDTVIFTKLKFYISNIVLKKDDKVVFKDKQTVHLLDADHKMSVLLRDVSVVDDFNFIEFGLGVDSVTNTKGALDGDLDPTLGMYWTWQSGYVNFKLEGKRVGNNKSEKEFVYHIGGYSGEKNAYAVIQIPINNISDAIHIGIDISKFMNDKDVLAHDMIMSPGEAAVSISKSLAKCFFLK